MHAPMPSTSRVALSQDGIIEGYASLFGEIDQARDMMMPGAFAHTLRQRGLRKIPMLFQHDPSEPVGPEDALGEGLKRGDYSSRVPGNHPTVVSTGEPEPIYAYIKDGKEVKPGTAGAERVLVDYKPGTRVVDQTAGLADVGDASGLKGGVETAAA